MKFLLLLLLFINTAFSQWEGLNPMPDYTWLYSVHFLDDDNGWIAGASGTILKYNPNKINWEVKPRITPHDLFSIDFFNKSSGLACGRFGTLLRSNDGGNNWTSISMNTLEDINQIYILNENTAFIAGNSCFLRKTTNSGLEWQKINVPNNYNLKSLFFLDTLNGFIGTDSAKILKTTDGGLQWSETNLNWSNIGNVNRIQFLDNKNGYAGGGKGTRNYTGHLSKTTDGGITWITENINFFNIRDFMFTDSTTGIIAGGENNYNKFLLYKNQQGYQNIFYHFQDFDISSCFITRTGKAWAVGAGGSIYYSQNISSGWKRIYSGAAFTNLSISANKNVFYASISVSSLISSEDYLLRGNFTSPEVNYLPGILSGYSKINIVDTLLAFANYGSSIYRTTDAGNSWNKLPGYGSKAFFLNKDTGWASEYRKLKKTTNGGVTWIIKHTHQYFASYEKIYFPSEQIGYVIFGSGLIKTTDGGNTWNSISTPSNFYISDIGVSDEDNIAALTGSGNVIVSRNGGLTWNIYNQNFLNTYYIEFFKNIIAVNASDGNVFISSDYGNSWITENIGGRINTKSFASDRDRYLLAATQNNIYKRDLKDFVKITGMENNSEQISSYKLGQNYPNPFNPVTRINFSVPENSFIKITLYDALGQEIKTLLEEEKLPGNYSFELNAASLSSGTYFYRMTAGNFISVKKLSVIK